jgi:hypothetical protein
MGDGTRTLTINISVNSARAISSLKGLKTALSDIINAGTQDALKQQAAQAEAFAAAAAKAATGAQTMAAAGATAAASMGAIIPVGNQAVQTFSSMSTGMMAMGAAAGVWNLGYLQVGAGMGYVNEGVRQLNPGMQLLTAGTQAASGGMLSLGSGAILAGQAANTSGGFFAGLGQRYQAANVTASNLGNTFRNNVVGAFNAARSAGQMNQAQMQAMAGSMDAARRQAYAMTIAGYQLVSAGNAITGSIKEAVSTFGEFDFSLRRAAGALGIFDDTGAMFNALSGDVQNLAIETKLFKPEELAKGLYYWASTTGQVISSQEDLNKIVAETLPIFKAAAMTETSMESSLKGVYQILSEFGLPMSRAADVTEKLFYVTQKTAVEFPDLINSFKMVGPVAAGMGVTFEDISKILGTLGNLGIKGSMAGRAIAMMFSRIAGNTGPATEALDAFAKKAKLIGSDGTFQNLIFPEGTFIGVQGFLNTLTEMTKNLNMQEKEGLLKVITTQNEWRILQPLIDANTASIRENGKGVIDMTDDLSTASSTMAQSWGLLGDSANAMFGEMSNKVAPLILLIGNTAVEAFRPLAKTIGDVAMEITKFAQAHPEITKLVVTIVGLAGVLMTASGAALLLAGGFKLIKEVALKSFFLEIGQGALQATGAMKVFHATLGLLKGLGAVLLMPFERMFSTIGKAFSSVAGQIENTIAGVLGPIFTKVGGATGGLFTKAFAAVIMVGQWAQTLWGTMLTQASINGGLAGRLFATGMSAALALAAPVIAVAVVWNVAQGEQDKVNTQGDALLQQALDYAKGATDKDLANSIDGVQKQLDGMIFNTYDSKNKVIGVLNALIEESNRRGAIAANASTQSFRDHILDGNNMNTAATVAADAYIATLTAQLAAQAASTEAAVSSATDLMFQNGNVKGQRYGRDIIEKYVSGATAAMADGGLKTAVQGMYDSAIEMMASSDPKVRSAGNQTMIALSQAFKAGGGAHLQPALQSVMATATSLLDSQNPAFHKRGNQMLIELAQGFRANKSMDAATKTTLYNAIKLLASGDKASQAIGANLVIAYANAMLGQSGKAVAAATSIRAKAMAALNGERNVDKLEGADAVVKPFNLMDVLGFTNADLAPDAGSSGGGGGSAADATTPLQKALEVAQAGASLAEALAKTTGMDIKGMVKTSMGKIAEAMLLADQITLKVTKGFSKENLQKVADFSDASGKVATLISGALDAFAKMADYKPVPKAQFVSLASDISAAVTSIVTASKSVKDKALAGAAVFSDSATKVLALVGAAIDAFAKMVDMPAMPDPASFDKIALMVNAAVIAIGNASKAVDTKLADAAKVFAEKAATVVTLVGSAFDAFAKSDGFVTPGAGVFEALAASIEASVTAVKTLALKMNLSKTDIALITTFSDTAAKAMSAIKSAFDAFAPRTQSKLNEGDTQILPNIGEQVAQIDMAMSAMTALADKYSDTKMVTKIGVLADTAAKVVTAVKDMFDLAQGTTAKEGEQGATMQSIGQQVGAALAEVMSSIMAFAAGMTNVGGTLVTNLAQGMQSQETALANEVANINRILSGVGGTSVVTFNVATTAKPIEIVHKIEGNIDSMTAAQVAAMLNAGNSALVSNISKAAATR